MFHKKSLFLLSMLFFTFIFIMVLVKTESDFISLNIQNENIELAIYLDDEETNAIPSKEGNIYDETRSSCTNGAYIIWDYESWSPVVKNMSEHKTKCELYFKTGYKEDILNGMDPVLEGSLIPVTIESDGTVKKADIGSEWYSYEKKNWANAVVLFDKSEDYLAGEVIPEEKIESYFVWIPKYRYQLWDLGQYDDLTAIDESKVHEIPILFGDYDTSDDNEGECTTPMESGATGNCTIGDYMTHPAFLSIPSTGFWVGKFEIGYRGATSTAEAQQNVNDSSKIIIKPNTYSWRGIQVANAFYNSYNYQRDLESHMMKNTEWGAVAYLQHSAYGSAASVRINNNSDYITGYQANNEPTCGWTANSNEECNRFCNDGTCNTAYPNSSLASTTGNITGIYDMSGGSWENLMGVMIDQEGNPMSGTNSLYNSGFNGKFGCPTCDGDTSGLTELIDGYDWPEKKYYDSYLYTEDYTTFQNRKLGDATGEFGPFANKNNLNITNRSIGSWYQDEAWFVMLNYPCFARSAHYTGGDCAGIFDFTYSTCGEHNDGSYRIVLTPTGGAA